MLIYYLEIITGIVLIWAGRSSAYPVEDVFGIPLWVYGLVMFFMGAIPLWDRFVKKKNPR
ncbi:MAG: hypothetical protein WCV59_01990 [Parcubacteria group bacterium]|jgi:hypothetical protein